MILEIPRWFLARLSPLTIFQYDFVTVNIMYGFSSRDKAGLFKSHNPEVTSGFHAQFIGYDAWHPHILRPDSYDDLFTYLELDAIEITERQLYRAAYTGHLIDKMRGPWRETGESLFAEFQPLDSIDLDMWGPNGDGT